MSCQCKRGFPWGHCALEAAALRRQGLELTSGFLEDFVVATAPPSVPSNSGVGVRWLNPLGSPFPSALLFLHNGLQAREEGAEVFTQLDLSTGHYRSIDFRSPNN